QHAEKADAETETQRIGGLWFVEQRGVIESQFGQSIAEIVVVVGIDWKHASINLRSDFLEAGQHFYVWGFGVGKRIPHWRTMDILDGGAHPAHFARFQLHSFCSLWRKHTKTVYHMGLAS